MSSPLTIIQDFSETERLNLHAEVLALQTTLGISYKDAAHRLYMAEVEKLKVEKQNEFAFSKIRETIDNTIINEIYPAITKIDEGITRTNGKTIDIHNNIIEMLILFRYYDKLILIQCRGNNCN